MVILYRKLILLGNGLRIKLEVPPIRIYTICKMNDTTQQILELYIEECKIKGKLLTIEEFSEDIDNTIGWDEFQF